MLTLEEKRAAYNIGFKHAKDLYEPKEAIWKKDSINSKYLICSACGAPIFLYAIESGEDPSKIKEFANVLASGFYQSEKQTAAIVLRNDILLRKIPITGGSQERKTSCCCIEHAISDFCQERPRKITYMKLISPVYSNNTKFKEEKK